MCRSHCGPGCAAAATLRTYWDPMRQPHESLAAGGPARACTGCAYEPGGGCARGRFHRELEVGGKLGAEAPRRLAAQDHRAGRRAGEAIRRAGRSHSHAGHLVPQRPLEADRSVQGRRRTQLSQTAPGCARAERRLPRAAGQGRRSPQVQRQPGHRPDAWRAVSPL